MLPPLGQLERLVFACTQSPPHPTILRWKLSFDENQALLSDSSLAPDAQRDADMALTTRSSRNAHEYPGRVGELLGYEISRRNPFGEVTRSA